MPNRLSFIISLNLSIYCFLFFAFVGFLGVCQMSLNRYESAIQSFGRVVSLTEDNGEAWGNLAALHCQYERWNEAMICINEAVKKNSQNGKLWNNYIKISYKVDFIFVLFIILLIFILLAMFRYFLLFLLLMFFYYQFIFLCDFLNYFFLHLLQLNKPRQIIRGMNFLLDLNKTELLENWMFLCLTEVAVSSSAETAETETEEAINNKEVRKFELLKI